MKNRKEKRNTLRAFLKKNGFYIAMVVLVAAGAVASYYAVMSLVTIPDVQSPSNNAEVSQPVPDQPIVVTPDPKPAPTPAPEPEPEPDIDDEPVSSLTEEPLLPVYTRPVSGGVQTAFSGDELIRSLTMNDWRTHNGADYSAQPGDPVVAVYSGEITRAELDPMWGYVVELALDTGYTVRYANLKDEAMVSAGQRVNQGDTIGLVGETAMLENGELPHLHFEARTGDKYIDPEALFNGTI